MTASLKKYQQKLLIPRIQHPTVHYQNIKVFIDVMMSLIVSRVILECNGTWSGRLRKWGV